MENFTIISHEGEQIRFKYVSLDKIGYTTTIKKASFFVLSSVCTIFVPQKQLVGLSLALFAHEESPGNTERPTS